MENKRKKILIIDDDSIFRKIMSDWFATRGFEIIGVGSGEEAFKVLAKEKIDVILSDVVMQPLNGLDILAKIKGDPKTKDIPVFMLSQMGEEDYINLAKDLGAEEYLTKSKFSLKELSVKIEKVVK